MRNLTINLNNTDRIDRNILLYQKGRVDGYMPLFNLIWRKVTVPPNSITPFTWNERYCFCIGKKNGNNHFDTLASREASPGDQVVVEVDYRSSEMMFGRLTPNDHSKEFMITTGMYNPMGGSNDNCVGLGIDNKLFNVATRIQPAMNYVFTPLPDYYLLASDKFNEGDQLTGEIEEMSKRLEFSSSGIIDMTITRESWRVTTPG
jgi:hypothetical protein